MTIDPLAIRSALVVAPHPDDELLGCGGLIAALAEAGARLAVLFVTDGGASHPGSRAWPRDRLATCRAAEAAAALAALGASDAVRLRLDLPDAGIRREDPPWRAAVEKTANLLIESHPDVVLAPWRRDPHRDHRNSHALVAEAIVKSGIQPRMLEYAIWLDELGSPGDQPGPGEVERVRLDIARWRALKRAAVAAHRSQLGAVVDDDPAGFVLSPETIARLTSGDEVYFEARR